MRLAYNTSKDFSAVIKPFVNGVSTDILGNIIAHKQGQGTRIMLIAHHDVVCLMVTYIDDNGFLYVKPSGGIDASLLPARKILIKHEDKLVAGVIGKKPAHFLRDEASSSKIVYDELWVDIGAKNRADATELVTIGDYAYFSPDYEELSNDLIAGPFFDDNAGLEVLLALAEQLHEVNVPCDVYFVASNYEEIGMRGAIVAAQAIQPDVCICVDVTHATDYPTMNTVCFGDIKLGKGCVLAKGPNVFLSLFDTLRNIAINNDIPYQIEVSPYPTGTDANVIQLASRGIKTAVVSIPCRYMHTPYEVCSKKDIASAVSIIGDYLQS